MTKPKTPETAPSTSTPVYALDALAATVGVSDHALLDAVLAGTTEVGLVELGSTIDTERIVTDTARIYGQAHDFWQQANAGQKKKLRGYSPELLALAVHQALALEHMRGNYLDQKDAASGGRAQKDAAAGE